MSNHILKISFLISPQKDIEQFLFFLRADSEYKELRSRILCFYPKIGDRIKQNEENDCSDIILDMHNRFERNINNIVDTVRGELLESTLVFGALEKYMNFPNLKNRHFIAIPTFLPFSPLDDKGNTFFFSIARAIAGNPLKRFRVIEIAVHEISHFIFFEQISNLKKKNNLSLNDASTHYFKEALTAAVMNKPEFRQFFSYENYQGNNELHNLFIKQNNQETNIVTFFDREIIHNHSGYYAGLEYVATLFQKHNDTFSQKWNLWNNAQTQNESEFSNQYRSPILI